MLTEQRTSNSVSPIDNSFTLRPNSGRNGNQKHPVPLVFDQHPQVGWIHEGPFRQTEAIRKLAVMHRSATGDQTYTKEAPTVRSLANTGGKHQGEGEAWKVVEHKEDKPYPFFIRH